MGRAVPPTAGLVPVVTLALVLAASCERAPQGPPEGGDAAGAGTAAPEDEFNLLGRGGGAYRTAPVAGPGTLVVTATYGGAEVPEPSAVPVDINVEYCGHKVFTEEVLADKETRGLRNVVVRLLGIRSGKPPPAEVTIHNRNCAFEPHVGVAVKGAKLKITSGDPVGHTTHTYLDGRSWFNVNVSQDTSYPARPIPSVGHMTVKCDVHKWMGAHFLIHDSPYIEVTGAKGGAVMEEIPPGTYDYVAWHETLGEKKGTVTIPREGTAQLDLEFTPRE